jgi:multidrug efflux pump subunit AcrB
MHHSPNSPLPHGGLAQYFVEKRGVAWLCLIGLMIWGWIAYHSLPQQEDPKIPMRSAIVVTQFAGATSDKVEDLVTQPLEKKISEMSTLEKLTSESRHGLSVITVMLQPQSESLTQQDWDKLRAKLSEVRMPDGAGRPWLNTDFGNTITLLYTIASKPITEGEVRARANLVRDAVASARGAKSADGRAAFAAFFPDEVREAFHRRTHALRSRLGCDHRRARWSDGV